MRKKSKYYEETILIPIYNEICTIIFTNDISIPEGKFNEKNLSQNSGTFLERDIPVLIFDIPVKHNTLTHEAEHLGNHILRTRGIINCTQCEEAFAYLKGYIVENLNLVKSRANKYFRDKK